MDIHKKLADRVHIDLIDLCWKCLYRWKAMLIAALIGGILLGAVGHLKDYSDYDKKKDNTTTVDELMAKMSDAELNEVYNIITQKNLMEAQKEYQNASILMHLNPYRLPVLKLKYLVSTGTNAELLALKNSYEDKMFTDEMADAIMPGLNIDKNYDKDYIKELISLGDDSSSTMEVLKINILLPEGADEKAIRNAIVKEFEVYSEDLNENLTEHTIALLSVEKIIETNEEVEDKISSTQSGIRNKSSYLAEAIKATNDDQYELYKYLTSENQGEIIETNVPVPGFPFKAFIFGAAAGIIIYMLFIFLRAMFIPTVTRAEEVQDLTGIRSAGEIHKFIPSENVLVKLIQSKVMFRLRYRKLAKPEVQSEIISNRLKAIVAKHEVKSAKFFCLDELNRIQEDSLETMGISVGTVVCELKNFSKVRRVRHIVLITKMDETKYSDIDELLMLCEDYGIKIIGTMMIDC